MKLKVKLKVAMFLILCGECSLASAMENHKDPRALDVLKKMAAYTSSLDQIIIKGEVSADAQLDAGLVISNPTELTIKIDRPGSLHLESFDGLNTQNIYIHKEELTIYGSEKNFYAQAAVPNDVEDAMQFALDNLDIDIPLGELFFADSALALMTEQDTVLYLTDKSRIRGVDCHHIVVRGDEIDLQLWVEEGDTPTPRKILMTMKWDGGSPRSSAIIDLDGTSGLSPDMFEFKPPEGAQKIKFFGSE